MVNTVPKGVKLSDPLTTIPVKPDLIVFQLNTNGELELSGEIRVRSMTRKLMAPLICLPQIVASDNSNSSVFLHINGRDAVRTSTVVSTTLFFTTGGLFNNFTTYQFDQIILLDKGASSFIVEIKENGHSTFTDNGEKGFPIPDTAVIQLGGSCLNGQTRNLTWAVSSVLY
jgi:hypothetical protein